MMLGKLFNTCIVLVVWFFVAGPLSKIISTSVNDALWTDRTAVDESAAFMGGLVGSGVYAILLVGGFWFLKNTWFPKKSGNETTFDDTKKENDTPPNNRLTQLLAKNVLFIGAACWLLYIWATGDNTYLIIAIALFLVTGFLLSRHGRKKQKSKVQNTDTKSSQYVQNEDIQSSQYIQNEDTQSSQYVQNTDTKPSKYEEPITLKKYGRVWFDEYQFDKHMGGLNIGIYLGILCSGIGWLQEIIYKESDGALYFFCFAIFIGLAVAVREFRKTKRVAR